MFICYLLAILIKGGIQVGGVALWLHGHPVLGIIVFILGIIAKINITINGHNINL